VAPTATETPAPAPTETPAAAPTSPVAALATPSHTPTAAPLAAAIPTDRQSEVATSNADLALSFPPGFSSAAASLEIRVEPRDPAGVGGPGVTALRAFRITALTADGRPVTAFQAPITVCATFAWESARGIAQSALAPYWVDPASGALRSDGLKELGLEEASPGRPGRLCFTTTHLTDFALAVVPPGTATSA
jgi:hypothetical protein